MEDYGLYVHTADVVGSSLINWAEEIQSSPGITYGCVLDKHLAPLRKGDLMVVVARPSHGKTTFLAHMARREAIRISRSSNDTVEDAIMRPEKECVLFISWEQSVEEIEAMMISGNGLASSDIVWGNADINTIRSRAIKRINLPMHYVGYSMRHAGTRRKPLYIETVHEAVSRFWTEYNLRPTLLCMDYLQIIHTKRGQSASEQVSKATYETKELLLQLGVPGIAGAQAKREVDYRDDKLPGIADAFNSSSIEHCADKVISL